MIIWLASYPKSGNTWVRILINQLLHFDEKNRNVLENLDNIELYPKISQFSGLSENLSNRENVVRNWVNSQERICADKKTRIFKTHNVLGGFGKDQFTNNKLTLGVIHIVRDPRNVISSILNHYSLETLEEAKKFIFEKNNWIGGLNHLDTFISSWAIHYQSWKSFKKNYLLIKYENLIKDPKYELIKISKYLREFFPHKLSERSLEIILDKSSFQNLKSLEKSGKFKEQITSKSTGEKINFFNLGPSNNWKKTLDPEISKKIEKEFRQEMLELGYL